MKKIILILTILITIGINFNRPYYYKQLVKPTFPTILINFSDFKYHYVKQNHEKNNFDNCNLTYYRNRL